MSDLLLMVLSIQFAEKWLLMKIPYSQYGKYLEDNNLIRVAAVGEQNITWEKVLVEKDINLALPQVIINVSLLYYQI